MDRRIYTTYGLSEDFSVAKEDRFFVPVWILETSHFDNNEAIGDRMSFVLVEEGAGVATIDDIQVPYLAPCFFCVNETEHIRIGGDDNKIRVLLFHPQMVNYSLDFCNIRASEECAPMTVQQDIALLDPFVLNRKRFARGVTLGIASQNKLNEMLDGVEAQISCQNSDKWPCRSRSYVMQLLFFLESLVEIDASDDTIVTDDTQGDINQILAYIYLHYSEKLTVTDITDQFHISRTTMSNMFKDSVGDSFLNYINKLRVRMATMMLRETYLSVSEIMYRVGYTDMPHFLRMFKRYTAMTPTAFRNANRSV